MFVKEFIKLAGGAVVKSEIDSSSVVGEPGTGFEKRNRDGKSGPFECGNCEFFNGTSCGQKDMMANSKQPKNAEGRPEVDKLDCCDYVDRVA